MSESNHTDITVSNGGIYNNNPNASTVNNIFRQGSLSPSLITEIINKLASKARVQFDDNINVDVISIEKKVRFNELRRWAADVSEFTPNSAEVDSIYTEFDMAGSSKTERVLFVLKKKYLQLSEGFHGDELFDKILEYVLEVVNNDLSLAPGIYREDVEYNARIVLVDAFIRCEIFKKPEE